MKPLNARPNPSSPKIPPTSPPCGSDRQDLAIFTPIREEKRTGNFFLEEFRKNLDYERQEIQALAGYDCLLNRNFSSIT